MNMRWYEIKENNPDIQQVATDEPVADTKEEDPAQDQPNYAELAEIKDIITQLSSADPDARFDSQRAAGTKAVRHIRAFNISVAELKDAIKKIGGMEQTPDIKQSTVSSSYPVYAFEKDDVLYTVVIGLKGLNKDDETSRGIGRKELSPTGLGIGGGKYSKSELIKITKDAVEKKYRNKNPMLADTLSGLLDNAATGGKGTLPQEQMDFVSPYLGTLSQDFGEILAPILVMDDSDMAELPSGNEALVDVRLPGQNMSVKALTGSGTSFRAIEKYMDAYEEAMENEDDDEKKERYNILKQFNPRTGGKNVDKIIRSAATANTDEYQKLLKVTGSTEILSFDDLENAVNSTTGDKDYSTFLKTFYPVMTAGPWCKPVGLPADGKYYMDPKGEPPKAKQAGKPSYDINPAKGGANILTYVLGIGLLNYITKGNDAEKYKEMMTDIVNKADAVIGHITVNGDGSLALKTRPFSDLKFNFQYHAPSHLPGNNLPGFVAILD